MKNPNATGNTGGAANAAPNPWDAVAKWAKQQMEPVKQESAASRFAQADAGEVISNKKEDVVSKFMQRRAERAEDKARKKYDKEFDKFKKQDDDYKELSVQKGEASDAAEKAKEELNAAEATRDTNKETYEDAKKEASRGEYIKDQGKRVFELLKAGGSVLKNSVRSFWKRKQGVKITYGDLADAGGDPRDAYNAKFAEGLEDLKKTADAKEAAKAEMAEIKKSFGERKATYKANVEARNKAKEEYKESQKNFSEAKKAEKEAAKECKELTEELNEAMAKYEKIDTRYAAAKANYEGAKEKTQEAEEKTRNAERIMELHAQLGKKDPNKVKAELLQTKEYLQRKVENVSIIFLSMLNVSDPSELTETQRRGYNAMLDNAGQQELNTIEQGLAVVAEYEAAKRKQAETVAKAEPVKKGLRGLIAGFFARKQAPAVASPEKEDEDE